MRRTLTVLVIIVLAPMSLTCARKQATRERGMRLFSFESQDEINALKSVNCRATAVNWNTADGKVALKITSLPGMDSKVEFRSDAKPWDWRGYDRLAMDVTNHWKDLRRQKLQHRSRGCDRYTLPGYDRGGEIGSCRGLSAPIRPGRQIGCPQAGSGANGNRIGLGSADS